MLWQTLCACIRDNQSPGQRLQTPPHWRLQVSPRVWGFGRRPGSQWPLLTLQLKPLLQAWAWVGGQELRGQPQAVRRPGSGSWAHVEPHPGLEASVFQGCWEPPAMTATPGQVLGTLLLTLLLRLTGEPECYPQRPSERAGITKPSHLMLHGRSS